MKNAVLWLASSGLLVITVGCNSADTSSTGSDSADPTSTASRSTRESASTSATGSVSTPPAVKKTTAEPSWGNLTGRFVYDGAPPDAVRLQVTKDQDVCGNHDLVDESVVVNKENGGLADVVVYLYVGRGDDSPPVHPSYDETATSETQIDNEHCRFEPHVCLLRTSQKLLLGNKDTVGHNTKLDTVSNPPINPLTPAGSTYEHSFSVEERMPARVSCSIHPWMSGWVLVRDNPYFAKTDENGHFEIKNVPTGEWTFQSWHGKASFLSEVVHDGNIEKWRRGRRAINIQPGENDFGEIRLKAELFQ